MASGISISQASDSSQKSFDVFHRRKIGSLRDNSKLFKILQQFENASKDNEPLTPLPKECKEFFSGSAPCSFNNKPNVEHVFALNPTTKQKISANNSAEVVSSRARRHSEGEVAQQKANRPSFDSATKLKASRTNMKEVSETASVRNDPEMHQSVSNHSPTNHALVARNGAGSYVTANKNFMKGVKPAQTNLEKDNYNRLRFVSVKSTPLTFQKDNDHASTRRTKNHVVQKTVCHSPANEEHTTKCVDQVDNPPPIPRRGLSLPVTDIMQNVQTSKKNLSPTSSLAKSPTSPNSVIKQDSVKKAIQMYEGLSSKSIKNHRIRKTTNYPKVVMKKEICPSNDNASKKTSLCRKSSRRNSFRTSKTTVSSSESRKHITTGRNSDSKDTKLFEHSKEDSGVGFSDTEDMKSPQGIYQTLCSVTLPMDQCDTYDRLNRIHDMVNRIHKGQSSTCAACKAIPIGPLKLSRTSGPSLVHVKCNELSPHHHPPCICFSCQHSVFSCSQNVVPSTLDISLDNHEPEENLYYNVCCLNGPNCEGWRRSRRRPVCEQNGRLCVVNCDIEKRKEAGNDEGKFYEKIFEWNTKKSTDVHSRVKQPSGDSWDSDEGWVDITDSEEEKLSVPDCSLMVTEIKNCDCIETPITRGNGDLISSQEVLHNVKQSEQTHSKLSSENISRATSSEHLYETIADIDTQNSSADDVRDKTTDNEPDSGEWSTESSSSPTPGDSSAHCIAESRPSTVPSSFTSKFTVASNVEYQDCATKKTFIKSVLGKKLVTQKKRKMSNFFVPWLVANNEYGAPRSPKTAVKKQSSRAVKSDNCSTKINRTLVKNQRSQSIPSCSTTTLSATKLFSSTEILDRCQSDMKELEHVSGVQAEGDLNLSMDSIDALSERGSVASSTYIRADQLHVTPVTVRPRPSIPEDTAITDVSVEKVFRRSSSGESMHSYIVFRPIKEEEVPLYQFYERNIKERVALCRSPESLSPLMWSSTLDNGVASHDCQKSPMKPQLSVVEQLSPDAKDIKMLWCELPEVKESGILERISAQELKLQEAAFEFIQSQASYIRSLKVLYEHFIQIPEFNNVQSSFCVLSKHEHDVLFSDVVIVKAVSEHLMAELTTRWSDGILIPDICDIIYRHATMPSFSIYVKYCSNRVYQEKTLKELKETRLCFLEVLRKLESNPACQGLSLESFLFLPMQHIARLPLLLDNIFRWLSPDSSSFDTCKLALESLHKTFMECNEGARKMERLEEMFILNKQLEFKECKAIPLISASRWLLKRGELVKLEFDKKTFGRTSRCLRIPTYIFLFNDMLVITKRKSEDSYTVLDYCFRDKVQAMPVDAKDLQQPDLIPSNCRYLIYLTLFSNHQGSAVDVILNCTLLSERTRWIEAIHPVPHKTTEEVWEYDSPQVQCVRSYIAQQPDELSLQESDVVTIHRKMNDGWYEGRRLRDGSQGWFPASYTMDIPCSRARASNLRQCYRLLMLSQKNEEKP